MCFLFASVKSFSCFLSFLQLNCYECLTWSALAVLSARPSFPLLRINFVRHMINLTSAKLLVMENISYKVKPASFSSCCKEQPSKKFFVAAWLIIFSFCRVLGIWDSQEFLFKSNACFTRALPVSFRFSQFFFLLLFWLLVGDVWGCAFYCSRPESWKCIFSVEFKTGLIFSTLIRWFSLQILWPLVVVYL